MRITLTLPKRLALRFALGDARCVAQTGIATIWQAHQAGSPVALKLYHDSALRNEGPGLNLMSAWSGGPVVRILDIDTEIGAVLMEWLPGPSLGDLCRSGRDREATEHLATVAAALRCRAGNVPKGLPRLSDWFADLLALRVPADVPEATRRDLAFAAVLARDLLASEAPGAALHGDLHHDNIRRGARGYTAFDAKGVWGEPTYELANAFRNPDGFDMASLEVIRYRADRWSARLRLERTRLLAWAAAKAGLSIAWQLRRDPVVRPEEASILSALCAEARAEG